MEMEPNKMTTNGNGVPSRIVELIISNIKAIAAVINELTKEVQRAPEKIFDGISRDLENLNQSICKIDTKVNTPPRNEELAEKLDLIIGKTDVVCELNKTIKWLFRSIWLVTIIISIVIGVASYVTHFSNKDLINQLKSENIKIEQSIDER